MASDPGYARARELLLSLVMDHCRKRGLLRIRMTPGHGDSDKVRMAKAEYSLLRLEKWSRDPCLFIAEAVWAPDPQGYFGGGSIPDHLAPSRMVPMILYPEQRKLVETLHLLVDADLRAKNGYSDRLHLNLVKSRQVAATTFMLGFVIWCWLFRPGFKAILTSYDESVIDGGGKGHREGDSLFARFRMMLDALVSMMPFLRFNQHRAPRWIAEQGRRGNLPLLGESDDTKMRIVRPEWTIFGHPRFRGARGNVIAGKLPSDKFAKSDSYTLCLMDEFGEYDRIGVGVDKKARESALPCCPHIATQGTIPDGGGATSHFKALADFGQTATLINLEISWTDVANYMLAAFFSCPDCNPGNPVSYDRAATGRLSSYGTPSPGPGHDGVDRVCEHCGRTVRVTRDSVSSPYFEMVKSDLLFDQVALARYYGMDWGAARGDRLFSIWMPRTGVVSRARDPLQPVIDGLDPGQTMKNAGAWICSAFDEESGWNLVSGYWMAAHPMIELFVPFIKRWSPGTMRRMRLVYGKYEGKLFDEVFGYDDAALEMMEAVSKLPIGVVYGDKYGSHIGGSDSRYEVLARYGIEVDWVKTRSRAQLVEDGVQWTARMSIDPVIADIRPPTPLNSRFPSVRDCFESAKPKSHGGQAAYSLDVDKQDPPHVHNLVDAWLYLCRHFEDFELHAVARADGRWTTGGMEDRTCVVFGDDFA